MSISLYFLLWLTSMKFIQILQQEPGALYRLKTSLTAYEYIASYVSMDLY